jgi:hypothetical protein
MALQLDTTLDKGVVANSSYARIVEIIYIGSTNPNDPVGNSVMVAFYFNEDARNADERDYLETRKYICEDESKESRADLYTWLKTLDDFAGATDV